MAANLNWIPSPYIYTVSGILLTTLFALGGFIIRSAVRAIKTSWDTGMTLLTTIEGTTRVQASNHLTHIQAETEKQTVLLEKVIGQITETNGYLRCVVDLTAKK
jgi:hypothetical protein